MFMHSAVIDIEQLYSRLMHVIAVFQIREGSQLNLNKIGCLILKILIWNFWWVGEAHNCPVRIPYWHLAFKLYMYLEPWYMKCIDAQSQEEVQSVQVHVQLFVEWFILFLLVKNMWHSLENPVSKMNSQLHNINHIIVYMCISFLISFVSHAKDVIDAVTWHQ